MKRTNPLWGSISILIGVVIAILSLLKDTWATVALIITFALWGLWLVWTQLLPAWSTNRAYRRRERQRKWQQDMISNDPDTNVRLVLLRHVNHRISEHLKSAFPKAHWEWTMSDPALFVAHGGTGRIRVYGVPDYDYADVTLNQQELDPRVWYEFQGRSILEDIIADLDSRGHSSLTMNEDGSIHIQPADGGAEITRDAFPSFPEKVYWPRLVNVLNQEGLTADMQDAGILVSW